MRLLVLSVGRKDYLCCRLAGLMAERGGELIGADIDARAPALACAHRSVSLPLFCDKDYWQVACELIKKEGIDAVLPLRHEELIGWSEHLCDLPPGLVLRTHPFETLKTCTDKSQLYEFADGLGIACPKWERVRTTDAWLPILDGPLVIKPNSGAGSQGVKKLRDALEFDQSLIESNVAYIVQELAEGPEYSADGYVNASGVLVACCIRERLKVRDGECVAARVVVQRDIEERCNILSRHLSFSGPFNAQFIDVGGEPKLIDLNPRFPGGVRFTEEAGYPFIEWWVSELFGKPVKRFDYPIVC
jgi:carbamoyl-phosphate synthase large subunit